MKFHRINFYQPKPESIACISYDELTCRIAVSRADNSIEIWNIKGTPCQETVIPGDANLSIECLCWYQGRLFCGGMQGYVLEFDLQALLPKYQILIMSGCPVWCMAANKKKMQLAVGNEDGYVSLIDVTSSGLDFNTRFNKQEGSILCIAWHKNGNIIVTGSADVIRTWDVQTGHVINRILLSRISKNSPTIVWCIAIISDMTIISGDSTGKISFWDGNTGTIISSSGSKRADILSLTISCDEDIIYTSGVEPTITSFMQSQSNGKWMKSIQRVVHTHDVRALQLVGDLLISGGYDCNLVFSRYPPKVVLKFYPFCQKSHSTLAPKASCILLQYPKSVELWKINQQAPVLLLRIKPKSNEQVISSSISSDGKWIAYSTRYQIRLFSISYDPAVENSVTMKKVDMNNDIVFSKKLSFNNESSKLICYNENKIFIFKCDTYYTQIEATIDTRDSIFSGVKFNLMQISDNDSYLAFSSCDGEVIVYSLEKLEVFCSLPKYKYPVTAMAFNPSSDAITVVYSDRKIIEYDIQKKEYTSWSKQEMLQDLKNASLYPITSMCYSCDMLFLLEENTIFAINKEEKFRAKKRVKNTEDSEIMLNKSNFKTINNYEHLSSIHSFHGEIVLVQIPTKCVLDSLPAPIYKKVYGT